MISIDRKLLRAPTLPTMHCRHCRWSVLFCFSNPWQQMVAYSISICTVHSPHFRRNAHISSRAEKRLVYGSFFFFFYKLVIFCPLSLDPPLLFPWASFPGCQKKYGSLLTHQEWSNFSKITTTSPGSTLDRSTIVRCQKQKDWRVWWRISRQNTQLVVKALETTFGCGLLTFKYSCKSYRNSSGPFTHPSGSPKQILKQTTCCQ